MGCLMDDNFCTRDCEGSLVQVKIAKEAGLCKYFGFPERGDKQVECDLTFFGYMFPFGKG